MTLHPAMKAFVDQLSAAGGTPDFASVGHAAGRLHAEQAGQYIPAGPDSVSAQDVKVAGYEGVSLDARLYKPAGAPIGLLVYLHGGGWVLSSFREYDSICRHFAEVSQCAVLSINYRRAPEHPFPIPAEDCYAATAWAKENCRGLLGNDLPLVVGGDSAGGNLTAAVCIMARDRKGPEIAAQLLIYPCVDSDFSRPSYTKYAKGGLLDAAAMQWFWDQYAPNATERVNPLAAPLRQHSLANLPPAFVEIAMYDPVRDEGETYAANMAEAGTQVTMRVWYGLCHGFFQLAPLIPPAMTASRQIATDIAVFLKDGTQGASQ